MHLEREISRKREGLRGKFVPAVVLEEQPRAQWDRNGVNEEEGGRRNK